MPTIRRPPAPATRDNTVDTHYVGVCCNALRTPKERLPSGVPKEEFIRMILEKNLPWGSVLKFCQCPRQLLVDVKCGKGTYDDPCILGRVLDSAFMQARGRLSCMNETNMQHTATATHCNTLQHRPATCLILPDTTLQHTTEHCNTPATHCNTVKLQHTATHCNTLHCNALQLTEQSLQRTASQRNTSRHPAYLSE